MTAATSVSERRERFKQADRVIAKGGNLRQFARVVGISPPGALKWLRRYDPDRLARLVEAPHPGSLTPHDALVRLLWLKATEGTGQRRRVCQALGISEQTLWMTRKLWAPDGLDAAIADLMPDEPETKGAAPKGGPGSENGASLRRPISRRAVAERLTEAAHG